MKWALPATDTYFRQHMTGKGFQVEHLERALTHVTRFRTAIDGGAHIGTWSCAMAERFDRVIAFEPAPDTWACLVRNIADHDNIEAMNYALGNAAKMVSVGDDASRPGNTGARFVREGNSVPMVRIDDMALADVDLLKLDVEGHEYFALQGATETIARCRPVVIIEEKDFGGRFGIDKTAAGHFLRQLGMREIDRIRNDCVFKF